MNLTFHIIRKDLRALRWGLLLWVAACFTHLGLRIAQQVRGDSASFNAFWRNIETTSRWDYAAMVILPILLIPLLLHLDPMRGQFAFWKTVPISRWRLLRAKAIPIVAFFVVLPLLCEALYFVSAGLSVVLGRALLDWALRYLPGIAAIVLGCLFTRSLKVGAPGVAVCLVVAFFITRWPYGRDRGLMELFRTPVAKPSSVVPMPPGASIEIEPASVHFERALYSDAPAPGKEAKPKEERLAVSLNVHVASLPEDVVVGAVNLYLNDIQLADRIVPSSQEGPGPFVYYASSGIPAQEQRVDMGQNYYSNTRDTSQWGLATSYLPMQTKDVPATGLPVQGTVRVSLARRKIVTKLPLQDNAAWEPGIHRFSITDVSDPNNARISFHTRMKTILADPRGQTGGLALTPVSSFVVWVEHNTLPYRTFRQRIPAEAWSTGRSVGSTVAAVSGLISHNADGLTDLTRSRRRLDFDHQFNPVDSRRNEATPLALMRFSEEQALARNWHVKIVTYSDVGTVELPLNVLVPRPAVSNDEDSEELRAPAPAFAKVLEEIKIPEKPSREEAEKLMEQIVERAARRSDNTLRGQENLLLDKLSALGAENIEVLLAAAAAAAPKPQEEENQPRNRMRWLVSPPGAGVFWRRVLVAACDLARPEDKALFLRYHSPRVDLLRAIVPNGWEVDALPQMCAYADKERVPESWRDVFSRHPGSQTQAALLAQVRLRTLSPSQVADFITAGVLPGREAATTLWESVVNNTGDIAALQPTFALATRHGVEVIPRDLPRILRLRREDWGVQSSAPFKTQQRGFAQSFMLRSDCPDEINEAAAWLESNALALAFNETSQRYELPGKGGQPRDLGNWGKYADPMGLGSARLDAGALVLTSGGNRGSGVDEYARVMREVDGDFTMEVTLLPAFDLAPAWNQQESGIFQSAGLLLIADPSRWIRWEHGLYKSANGHQLREETMRAGKNSVAQRANDKWDRAKPVRLRLSRHGDLFTTAWSQEGGAWVESPASRNIGWPRKVIIGAMINNGVTRMFSARFSDLKFEASSLEPAQSTTPIEPHPTGPATASGTDLGEWGVVENPIGAGLFTKEVNTLSIAVAPNHSDYNIQQRMTAPRAMREVEGDFTFEATIEPSARLDWNSSELLLTAGPDFYLRVGIAASRGNKVQFHNERAEMGRPVGSINMDAARDLKKPLRIRLQRRGHFLLAAQQRDGGEWVQFRPVYFGAWPSKIQAGVTALNTSKELYTAKFSDVKLTRDAVR